MTIIEISCTARSPLWCRVGRLQPRGRSADDDSTDTDRNVEDGGCGDAPDRGPADPRAHQGALRGRIRRTAPRNTGRGEDRPVPREEVRRARAEARQYRRQLRPEGAARRPDAERSAAAGGVERRAETDAQVVRRLRRLHQARRRDVRARQHRDGVRRLRCRRTRIQLGRLQGSRRQGQDDRRAGQRSAGSRRLGSLEARSKDVQRQRDDLLRPLDLQVRGGGSPRRSGDFHRPRDWPGRVSVFGRAGVPRRALRFW